MTATPWMRWSSFALALLVAAPAAARTVAPREDNLNVIATAGQEKVIRTYASWVGRTCAANPPPQVVLRSQPKHGTVTIRPGTSTIREVREGTSQLCVGTTLPGTAVVYTPSPGFRGEDGFDYTITSVNGVFHDTVALDVR